MHSSNPEWVSVLKMMLLSLLPRPSAISPSRGKVQSIPLADSARHITLMTRSFSLAL